MYITVYKWGSFTKRKCFIAFSFHPQDSHNKYLIAWYVAIQNCSPLQQTTRIMKNTHLILDILINWSARKPRFPHASHIKLHIIFPSQVQSRRSAMASTLTSPLEALLKAHCQRRGGCRKPEDKDFFSMTVSCEETWGKVVLASE